MRKDDVRDDQTLHVARRSRFSSVKRMAILCILVIQVVPAVASRPARSEPIIFDQTTAQELLGQHNLMLQWQGVRTSKAVGKAKITRTDNGDWRLTARQTGENVRVELDGLVIEIDTISFKFSGKVVIRIGDLADGKVCHRNGPFTFLEDAESAGRTWRLLQAGNPCGTAIDSVDLYLQ